MVHHVRAVDLPRRFPLPDHPCTRFALLSVIATTSAVALLGVTVFGGLDKADPWAEPAPPGTELENDLFTVTPHEARVHNDDLGTYLQVRADIELRGSQRPVGMFDVGGGLVLRAEPAGESIKRPEIRFERRPEAYVSHLQPHMAEESAVLSWEVPDGVAVSGIESLGFALHGIDLLETTGGSASLWVGNDDVVGAVSLPLDGG